MAKAITEIAIGGAAIASAFVLPGLGVAVSAQMFSMLIATGSSMVLAGAAEGIQDLQNKGGIAIGVASPIGPWAYIYGTQKVGGIKIFEESNSSQGTSNDKELHRVYALACHPCVADAGTFQFRIDGKQVLLRRSPNEPGWESYSPTQVMVAITSIVRDSDGLVTVHLASGIAGLDGTNIQITEQHNDNSLNGIWIVTQPDPADDTTFTFVCGGAPCSYTGGQFWTLYADYQDKIYIEFLNGNHTATFGGLLSSGTSWKATDLCLGHTLVYVRMGYDETVFPSTIPNVSFVIQGKNDILDPRTGTRGFTNNAALCIADYMSLPRIRGGFGLAIGSSIPTANLIAAANICDEAVSLAGGGTTPRYTCDTYVQLTAGRGSILQNMLSSCAGRLTYQGGIYNIVPGATVAATLQLTDADIISIKGKSRFSIRGTCNAVKGIYVSPENDYQQGDFPAYMQDAEHGFVTDPWLAEDRGERIFKELNLSCTNNSAIAQRLAKIEMLRIRYQGRYTIRTTMKGYQAVALDVIQITHPRYTWLLKNFEVLSSRIVMEKINDVTSLAVEMDIAETDPSIYDWSIDEQLTPQGYAQPDSVGNSVCQPPDDVSAYSGPGETVDGIVYPSTITTNASGISQNSIYVRWNTPNDANVVSGGHLEMQWQLNGASSWNALANISPTASSCFIFGVTDGAQYCIRIRAVNCAGVPSSWEIAGPVTISSTLSSIAYSGISVAPAGTLIAQAFSDGTAAITVLPFTPSFYSAPCTPAPSILTGLNQGQIYSVYYVDLLLAGGNITPIATQNTADFLNKHGYFLIGQIATPTYTPRYLPSTCMDSGTATTANPEDAYDGDVTTAAVVSAAWNQVPEVGPPPGFIVHYDLYEAAGICTWNGFPGIVTAAPTVLNIIASVTKTGSSAINCVLSAAIAGTPATLATITTPTGETVYTLSIPSGTNLSDVTVTATPTITSGSAPGAGSCALRIFEIYIQ